MNIKNVKRITITLTLLIIMHILHNLQVKELKRLEIGGNKGHSQFKDRTNSEFIAIVKVIIVTDRSHIFKSVVGIDLND